MPDPKVKARQQKQLLQVAQELLARGRARGEAPHGALEEEQLVELGPAQETKENPGVQRIVRGRESVDALESKIGPFQERLNLMIDRRFGIDSKWKSMPIHPISDIGIDDLPIGLHLVEQAHLEQLATRRREIATE